MQQKPISIKGMIYAIVRSYSAGVFAGYVNESKIVNRQTKIFNARRIWHWEGAASLSQLSQEGTSKPQNCKFPMEVPEVILTDICEIIPASKDGVKIWQQ